MELRNILIRQRNKLNYTHFLFLIPICLLVMACDSDEQCREDNYVMLKIGFYKAVIDSVGVQKLSNKTIDSISAESASGNFVLMYNKNKTSIDLPLHKFENFTEFDLLINDTLETISIWHTNTEKYLSFECGCLVTHIVDSVKFSENFIDSISITNNDVNTQNAENIKVYRHYDTRK